MYFFAFAVVDGGTEDNLIKEIQSSILGEEGVKVAVSKRNVPIERMWREVVSHCVRKIFEQFSILINEGVYDSHSDIDRFSLACCAKSFVQERLDAFREIHNNHRIRNTRGSGRKGGYVNLLWLEKADSFAEVDVVSVLESTGYNVDALFTRANEDELQWYVDNDPLSDIRSEVDVIVNSRIRGSMTWKEVYLIHREVSRNAYFGR